MDEEIRPTRKASTSAVYEMYFRRHLLPALGDIPARELSRNEGVTALHRSIGVSTPVTANRVVTLLSGLYTWAAKVGEVPEGFRPTKGITKYREEGCERFLSMEELGRLGDALREAETVVFLGKLMRQRRPLNMRRKSRTECRSSLPSRRRPSGSSFSPAADCAKFCTCAGKMCTSGAECSFAG